MTTATDLDALVREHAERQAAAEAAAEKVAAAESAMIAAQMQRREEFDREFVESYRGRLAAIDDEARRTKIAFYDAVVADPVVSAWVAMRACRWRRGALQNQMAGALVRLGNERDAARYSPADYREPRLFEDVLDIAEDEAQRIATDEDTALVEAREAYAVDGTRDS